MLVLITNYSGLMFKMCIIHYAEYCPMMIVEFTGCIENIPVLCLVEVFYSCI